MTRLATESITVALVGNPNTGKSTLFTALAGIRQRVGNYPGVTVEKKIGRMQLDGQAYTLVDLPGTYSLAPRAPDEMVAVDVLLGRRADTPLPDVVLCIVDASNLQRNLYLFSQVLELGRPTVLALNMVDLARQKGISIDVARLRSQLGVPIVELQANRGVGVRELKAALAAAIDEAPAPPQVFPEAFRNEVEALVGRSAQPPATASTAATHVSPTTNGALPRYLVERLLLDTSGYLEQELVDSPHASLRGELAAARTRLVAAGCPVPAVEATARYGWIDRVLGGVVTKPSKRPAALSDKIDRVLTHRVWGTAIFLVLMALVFQSVFRWAVPLMDLLDAAKSWLAGVVSSALPAGALSSLLTDGIIEGVGGVLIFLPQILILFFFIALLEDCGYMARAAYLMDRLMVRVGLSGKSFIPLLSSFACAIPGIMATRVIENRRDRLTTILIAPLMSCSARLPVYTLLIAAFVPAHTYLGGLLSLQALTLLAMYFVGIAVAAVVALLLKRTFLRGPTPPFVMELPSYKWPSPTIVIHRMLERGWSFVRRAGTLIVAVAVLVWAGLYFPHDPETVEAPFRAEREQIETALAEPTLDDASRGELEERLAEIENETAGAYERQSILARMGKAVEPAVRPLGWDWRIATAAIASFPAREVIVATLGIIYNLGPEAEVEDTGERGLPAALRSAKWDDTGLPVFSVPVALSIMVFFALCAQCGATLVVIRRETNSWFWPVFAFVYMTVLAYLGALVTYQVGTWLSA